MDTLFYKKNFRIIREKLEPELKRLMASRENYAKLVGYLVVAEDQMAEGQVPGIKNGGTGSLFESVALQSCFTNNRSQQ